MENKYRKFDLLTVGLISIFPSVVFSFIVNLLYPASILIYAVTVFLLAQMFMYINIWVFCLPLLFNVFGIIFGIINIKNRFSVLCIVLSLAGFVLNSFWFLLILAVSRC